MQFYQINIIIYETQSIVFTEFASSIYFVNMNFAFFPRNESDGVMLSVSKKKIK